MYKVKAFLLADSGVAIKYGLGIIIIEPNLKSNQIIPVNYHQEKRFLFAFGKVKMDITFEKPAFYNPGDMITIKLHLDNDSSKTVDACKVKLMRYIKVKAEDLCERHSIEVCRQQYEGCAPESKHIADLTFAIPPNIFPTTHSDQISNSYSLIIECDIPMAFDLESKHDINIALLPKSGDVKLYTGYLPKSW